MKNKLTFLEAISVIAIISISQIILDFPEYLIHITGTGTIINLIFLAIISIVLCYVISNIFTFFANQDIIDISEFIGGKFLKTFISIFFIIFLGTTAFSATSSFIYLVKNIYLENDGFLFIASLFFISIFVSCFKGFETTKKVSTFFFGLLAISIICLIFGDNGNFNNNNLFPILGYNYKTTFGIGMQNIFIFNFILIYFFLMPLISRKNEYRKIVLSSFIINFLFIIISVIAILQYYPASITDQFKSLNSTNLLLAVTRRIQLTSFLSQTDSIFFLFWTYSILCYIAILLEGIFHILDKNFKYENKQYLTFSVIPILIAGVIFINHITNLEYLENTVFKALTIIIFCASFAITILGYFKKRKAIKCKK